MFEARNGTNGRVRGESNGEEDPAGQGKAGRSSEPVSGGEPARHGKPAGAGKVTGANGSGPAGASGRQPLDAKTVRRVVNTLEDRERRYGFLVAALAAIVWLSITIPYLVHPVTHGKNRTDVSEVAIYLTVGLVLAGVIFAGAWIRRRALLAFAALFAGFAFGGLTLLLAIPFFVFGGWLIWRTMKLQREAEKALGMPLRQASGSRSSGNATKAGSGERRGGEGGTGRRWLFGRGRTNDSAPAPVSRETPAASKRYTPPKVRRKAGPQSGKSAKRPSE